MVPVAEGRKVALQQGQAPHSEPYLAAGPRLGVAAQRMAAPRGAAESKSETGVPVDALTPGALADGPTSGVRVSVKRAAPTASRRAAPESRSETGVAVDALTPGARLSVKRTAEPSTMPAWEPSTWSPRGARTGFWVPLAPATVARPPLAQGVASIRPEVVRRRGRARRLDAVW